MSWSLRFDVFEDEGIRVFIDLLCGNLAVNDTAEETIHLWPPDETWVQVPIALATDSPSLIAPETLRLRVCSGFARSVPRVRDHRFARAREPIRRLVR